jgi:hypothetical protein
MPVLVNSRPINIGTGNSTIVNCNSVDKPVGALEVVGYSISEETAKGWGDSQKMEGDETTSHAWT